MTARQSVSEPSSTTMHRSCKGASSAMVARKPGPWLKTGISRHGEKESFTLDQTPRTAGGAVDHIAELEPIGILTHRES